MARATSPTFQVRAVGAFEQKPGCPADSRAGLSNLRLERLCRGECYHPGDRRKRIDRIEVVRIRPQTPAAEPIEDLVEDPWKILDCPPGPAGCRARFEDPDFAAAGRDAVYYVRAIQEASPTINGDALRCERDESGRCLSVDPCHASETTAYADDCLSEVEERAWSSPIFVDHRR